MSVIPDITIVAENNVPKRRPKGGRAGRPRDAKLAGYIQQLCDLRVGQSCFFGNLTRTDIEFLRRPAVQAGINLTIRELDKDEIHMTPGVRVWREEGIYDEL